MTVTQQRPDAAGKVPRRPAGWHPPVQPRSNAALVASTATVAGGMFLTTLPLSSIFTDWQWLTVSVGCALPYLLIVCGLRYRGTARWWHSVVGLLASVLMLLWVFVPQHLLLGVIPTPASGSDINSLLNQAHTIMQADHAPLASNAPLRLLVAAALVGLTCLTDVLGVLLRQPLIASAPLLEILAVASATSSKSANPFWFAAAAVGFLLILLAGTRLQDIAWGPSVDGSAGRLGGGRRMAVTGIVAALLVPLLLPAVPTNLLARAAHHNGNGSGAGVGNGQVVLNNLASLRGSLQRPNPTNLFQVHVGSGDEPFYVRQEVDDQFTNDGWQPTAVDSNSPETLPLSVDGYPVAPAENAVTGGLQAFPMQATFTIQALGGKTLPILANPSELRVPNDAGFWDSGSSNVSGVSLKRNLIYTEAVQQLAPSIAQLRAAPDWNPGGDRQQLARYLGLPQQPEQVVSLAKTLTANLASAYDKAKAISDYFTNGKNGFVYSINAPANDGSNALVAFLTQKQGFCQQYAAAAAVLMREAGLPTRVVLGYTHGPPDANGNFTVTTSDAHAWVEVYFSGIGWVPFDPTPLTGADAGRAVALPWAAHPSQSAGSTAEPTANKGISNGLSSAAVSSAQLQTASNDSTISPLVWQIGVPVLVVLVLLLLIVLGPRFVRRRQRHRRLDRARSTGNPELLWLELAATATDRNALWPDTLTVGQVPDWLGKHGVDERGRAAVQTVASTVERDRFSPRLVSQVPPESVTALDQALTRWARRTDRRLSLLNRWLPKSLLGRSLKWHR
jgi:transglutaminase-like putative cysteine protease